MTSEEKPASEMSWVELKEKVTRDFGLPPPPDGAPSSEYKKWFVAVILLDACRTANSPAEGKLEATNYLLQRKNGRSELVPHIERALGRKLLPSELAGSCISHV